MAGKPPESAAGKAPDDSNAPSSQPAEMDDEISPFPPMPVVSPLLARRLNAKVLDPESVSLAPGQSKPLPTVYVSDVLLVRESISQREGDADARSSRVAELQTLAADLPDPVTVTPDEPVVVRRGSGGLADDVVTVTRVTLSASADRPSKSADAWKLLQAARSTQKGGARRETASDHDQWARRELRREDSQADGVSLEHVLTAGGGLWGGAGGLWGGAGGLWGGAGGLWGGAGGGALMEYGSPGVGGRTPVVWSAPDPRRNAKVPSPGAPVVAVLDTGLGVHPWFKEQVTTRDDNGVQHTTTRWREGVVDALDFGIGLRQDPTRDPENTGVIFDRLNGLVDALCGHGTFVTGIVRQRCPEATIISVPVMAGDGVALEGDVVTALSALLERHRLAKNGTPDEKRQVGDQALLDVVNLSLGYYHETPEDASDTVLHDLLQQFVDEGVAVVAAAGNGATRAAFFPAAFAAPRPSGQSHGPANGIHGLVGVGATNPEGHTIALFTNNGPWVTAHAPGAGIVSTVPTTLSGSARAQVRVDREDPGPRATVDADDFSSGFAIWSGTSFAAPWIAGEIAAEIVNALRATGGDESAQRSGTEQPPPRALAAADAVVTRSAEQWTR